MGIIIRQSIKGTLLTYIGAFIGFLTTLFIVPKYLGEEIYGLTRVILEAGLFFAFIFQLGSTQSAIRFFPHFKSEDKKHNGFFFYLISLATIGILLFVAVFFILKDPISSYFSSKSSLFVDYIYWVVPLVCFIIYWLTFEVYSTVLMRIAIPKFIREIVIRVLLIAVYLAYSFGYIGLDGFIMSFVGVYALAMLCTFAYVSRIGAVSLRHEPSFITPSFRKEFFAYTPIIILGAAGSNLISKIDVFMISGMEGLAWTGIYSVAFYMISIVEIPARSITAISSPIASEALRKGDRTTANQLYKKVSLHQLLIGSALFLLIWINIDNIYDMIPNGDVYRSGKWVVFYIGLARLIEVTLGFGGILIGYTKYFRWTLFFTLFISVITVLLNYLLIPRFGISGAALSTASACLISFSLQQWIIFRKIKANPYSKGTLKLLITLVLVFSLNYLIPTLSNPLWDTLIRSLACGLLFLLLTYFLRISEEVNQLIRKIFKLRGEN
jgi:Membrane protein involved in the export of O-antigen and teichoic acid